MLGYRRVCSFDFDSDVQLLIYLRRVVTPAMTAEFGAARDDFLGPRPLRTRKRPVKPTNAKGNCIRGELTGGIAYERSKICRSVQEPARCYTLGPSGEAPTSIVSPVASAKMPTEVIDGDAAIRQRVLNVSCLVVPCLFSSIHLFHKAGSAIASAAFSEAPSQVQERTREIASLCNVPTIGVPNNYAYATCQANVATARRPVEKDKNGKNKKRKKGT
jgi:hypothetical protein